MMAAALLGLMATSGSFEGQRQAARGDVSGPDHGAGALRASFRSSRNDSTSGGEACASASACFGDRRALGSARRPRY